MDRSYFRVMAKAHLRIGLDLPWLHSLFAGALQPDLIILLDIDPALAWQRRSDFPIAAPLRPMITLETAAVPAHFDGDN